MDFLHWRQEPWLTWLFNSRILFKLRLKLPHLLFKFLDFLSHVWHSGELFNLWKLAKINTAADPHSFRTARFFFIGQKVIFWEVQFIFFLFRLGFLLVLILLYLRPKLSVWYCSVYIFRIIFFLANVFYQILWTNKSLVVELNLVNFCID